MMDPLFNVTLDHWEEPLALKVTKQTVDALESGRVIFFPKLAFSVTADEAELLDPACSDGRTKNVSFDPVTSRVKGASLVGTDRLRLQGMIARFAAKAHALAVAVLPDYASHLRWGRTSYRPIEIKGRPGSYRKDDTRLHVDAFPSRPNGGERILRVFSNISDRDQNRLWRVGESFEDCARQFLPRIRRPWPGNRWILQRVGATHGYRSLYDHYMLNLHDVMKRDDRYQRLCPQSEVVFPAATTWMVFTDQVPHAVMAGQFLLEQTFHISVDAMRSPDTAPLRILERLARRRLA